MTKNDNKSEQDSKRFAWTRAPVDHSVSEWLGQQVRKHRQKHELTLGQASELSGIPSATLSRIETNKMTPTFPVLLKLMTGLRLPWSDLMSGFPTSTTDDEPSIALPGEEAATSVPGYAYSAPHQEHPLCTHIQPLIIDVLAQDLESAGGLRGHAGYEFCFVIEGTIQFHTEGKDPQEIPAGGSLLFRCDIPHAYVAASPENAKILNITLVDPIMMDSLPPFENRSSSEE